MATFSCISTTVVSSIFVEHQFLWISLFSRSMKLHVHWSTNSDDISYWQDRCPWIYVSLKWNWNFLNPRKLVPANIDETTMSDYYLTLSHFLKTSSWNSKNLSLIGWEFTGRDRKWVKGSFRRTESTITSIRVLAETTPFLSGPVITEINKLPECFSRSHFKTFL